jgi:hypothetical protein
MNKDDYPDVLVTQAGVDARHARACAERSCYVVQPNPDQLLVDIDSYESLGIFHANYPRLGDLAMSYKQSPSPSRKSGRYHITVKLSRPVRDNYERILLQCLLGSDLAREILSWREVNANIKNPTVFFEKKQQAEKAT